MPHMTNNQYFIRPLWCNGESLLGFFSWVGSTPLLRSLMIALLFVIPDHWLLPQSRDLKKSRRQGWLVQPAGWPTSTSFILICTISATILVSILLQFSTTIYPLQDQNPIPTTSSLAESTLQPIQFTYVCLFNSPMPYISITCHLLHSSALHL